MTGFGESAVFGQRIDVNGATIGGNIGLIDDQGPRQTSPAVAVGPRRTGVARMRGNATLPELTFATLDHALHPMMPPALNSPNMASRVYPSNAYNHTEF